jgi:hypothetical protein
MRIRGAIALLLTAFLSASPALAASPAPSAGPADGVVAAIEFNAIMLSTLRAYQQAFMPEQPAALALESLINDSLLAREANRYGQTLPSETVIKESKARPIPGTLTPIEWQQLLATHMLAQRFLDFRFGDFVPVSRDEIRAYYEAHRDRFSGPIDQYEELIRGLLVPAVRARRVASYEEELRTRYNVRINGDLVPKE